MDEVYHLLKQRNAYETDPFQSIHKSNLALQNQVDVFQKRCNDLIREYVERDLASEGGTGRGRKKSLSVSRNEAELMDKIESLQKEIDERFRVNEDLQTENDELKKKNEQLIKTQVTCKEEMMDQFNELYKNFEKKQKEVDMLQLLLEKERETSAKQSKQGLFSRNTFISLVGNKQKEEENQEDPNDGDGRLWGSFNVTIPSTPSHTIQAHPVEAMGVRYDDGGGETVATAGTDSTIKVWNTQSGQLCSTLRGSTGQAMLAVDMVQGLVAGCSSDKTCRVWNVNSSRMVHHLVGHMHKITCMRICANKKNIITGSADRSIRVWDISRSTYRQGTTFRHSSTTNCMDILSTKDVTVVSGHMDGSVRFWDIRSGDRTADIPNLHEGGVTSVQFDPTKSNYLLTNGRDSRLKITDVRMCNQVNTFHHRDFKTLFGWSSSCYSPDGKYVAAGSSSPGTVFIWRTTDGKLEKKLENVHSAGVVGIAWGRGGSNGQQLTTVDRKGSMVLWA